MGDSSKKTSSTDNASAYAVTTPTNPDWTTDPMKGYASRVGSLMQTAGDGSSFVAPASSLQSQAFSGAAGLGSWQDIIAKALGAVNQATSSPTPTYSAAPTAQVAGYTPALVGQAAQIANTGGAGAGTATASLIKDLISGKGLSDYSDPYTGAVVDTTLAGLDKQNGSDLANFDAQSALNKSFGGSGAAIGRTNLVNSQALSRAQEEASLRSAGFDRATALAGQDASALTGVSQSNAANVTQANIASAQIAAQRAQAQAELEQATRTGDQNAINVAAQQVTQAEDAANLQGAARTDAASHDNQASLLQTIQNLLSGGQILGSLGNSQAANATQDITTQATLGAQQRAIDADQRDAPLNLLQLLQSLTGYNPSLFTGSTQSKNSTETRNTTETSTPSLLSQIGQGIGIGSSLLKLPGGSAGMNSLLSIFTGKQDPLNLDDPTKLLDRLGG